MKKMHILMSCALIFVGTAMYSCVDDDESDDVKAWRQAGLEKDQAAVETLYINAYNKAQARVEELLGDLADAQEELDDLKKGKASLDEAKAIAVAYYEKQIAVQEENIKTNENELKEKLKTAEDDKKASLEAEYQGYIRNAQNYIKGYNQNIADAENEIVDYETAVKYYNALIAEINSEIEFQKELAALYRSRLEALISTTTTAE